MKNLNINLTDTSKEEYQEELIQELFVWLYSIEKITNEYGYTRENPNSQFLKDIIEYIKKT